MSNTNAEFAETNNHFRHACDIAGIKPTKRQASKFRNGRRGLALKRTNNPEPKTNKKTLRSFYNRYDKKPSTVRCQHCGRFVGKNQDGYGVRYNYDDNLYYDLGSTCKNCS